MKADRCPVVRAVYRIRLATLCIAVSLSAIAPSLIFAEAALADGPPPVGALLPLVETGLPEYRPLDANANAIRGSAECQRARHLPARPEGPLSAGRSL